MIITYDFRICFLYLMESPATLLASCFFLQTSGITPMHPFGNFFNCGLLHYIRNVPSKFETSRSIGLGCALIISQSVSNVVLYIQMNIYHHTNFSLFISAELPSSCINQIPFNQVVLWSSSGGLCIVDCDVVIFGHNFTTNIINENVW